MTDATRPDEAAVEALAEALDATFASHDVGPLPLVGPGGLAARTMATLADAGWSVRRSETGLTAREVERLRETLRAVLPDEPYSYVTGTPYCRWCGSYLRDGHEDDCRWVAAHRALTGSDQ